MFYPSMPRWYKGTILEAVIQSQQGIRSGGNARTSSNAHVCGADERQRVVGLDVANGWEHEQEHGGKRVPEENGLTLLALPYSLQPFMPCRH